MKKFLPELTREEVADLYDRNEGFRNRVFELHIDGIDFYVEDVLRNIPEEAKYDVGYSGVWMNFNQVRYNDVVDYFKEIQEDYCIFPEDFNLQEKLDKYYKYSELAEDANYGYIRMKEKDCTYMENTAKEILGQLVCELVEYFREEYIINEDELRTLAYEQYIEAGFFDDYYINGLGELYQIRQDLLIK